MILIKSFGGSRGVVFSKKAPLAAGGFIISYREKNFEIEFILNLWY
jgi:hypothetical protein